MSDEEFERLVVKGYESLPEWVREKVQNVALLVEDEPSEEDREAQGLSDEETLLGLYKGIPLTERGELYGVGMTLPDTITLYRFPIEDEADEITEKGEMTFEQAIEKVVAETIWHEYAHHFGMDEAEVRHREQERS